MDPRQFSGFYWLPQIKDAEKSSCVMWGSNEGRSGLIKCMGGKLKYGIGKYNASHGVTSTAPTAQFTLESLRDDYYETGIAFS